MWDHRRLWRKLHPVLSLLFASRWLPNANLGELWLQCGPKLSKIPKSGTSSSAKSRESGRIIVLFG
jgi:hypothetical protein